MKKFKITFLLIIFALVQGCQQSEPIQKPVLNEVELENVLRTNLTYKALITDVNVASNALMEDLASNFSKLPKEELEEMNSIWVKYGSSEDFIQLATESEKSLFGKMALKSKSSSDALNNSISKLLEELSFKYSYKKVSVYNVLLSLYTQRSQANSRSNSVCMHKALAEYYSLLDQGFTEHTAYAFAVGYYSGCVDK